MQEAGHEGEGAGGGEIGKDVVLSLCPHGVPTIGDTVLLLLTVLQGLETEPSTFMFFMAYLRLFHILVCC